MNKRIWLKVDEIEFHLWEHFVELHRDPKELSVWVSVRLGQAFDVRSLLLNKRLGCLSQGWGNISNMRFLDCPALHKQQRGRKSQSLDNIIAQVVYDTCLVERKSELSAFITKKRPEPQISSFKPGAWKGLSLRIPVDFVEIFNIEGAHSGSVYANIRVGHHLIFWRVKIFENQVFCSDFKEAGIRDDGVRNVIRKMLKNSKLRKIVKYLHNIGGYGIDRDFKFLYVLSKGYNPDSPPPPVRFY